MEDKEPLSRDVRTLMTFEASKKSHGVTYLLWFFLGFIGGHRFYLGHIVTAIVMIVVCLISIPMVFVPIAIWWVIEFFLVPSNVAQANHRLIRRLEK